MSRKHKLTGLCDIRGCCAPVYSDSFTRWITDFDHNSQMDRRVKQTLCTKHASMFLGVLAVINKHKD